MAKTYHISFDNITWSEFTPSNDPIITYEREGDEIFLRYKVDVFRINKYSGPFGWVVDADGNFVVDADGQKIDAGNISLYETIESMFFDSTEFGNPIYFKIQKAGADKYLFRSSVNDGSTDSQNAVFEISPRTDDDYYDVLNKYDTKYRDRAGTALFGGGSIYYPDDKGNQFINVDFAAFSDVANSITWTNSAAAGEQKADYTLTTNFSGQIVQVTIVNYTTDGAGIRLRLWDSVGAAAVSADVPVSADGIYTVTQNASSTGAVALRLSQQNSAPPNVTGSLDYVIYEPILKGSAGDDLQDFMQRLVGISFMNTGLVIKSTYLWNDAVESDPPGSIDTYITAHPTNDYVIQSAAIWNDLFFGRVDAWTTDKQTQVDISFKDLMDILKYKLRAWWFIDSDGYLRIEHEKYFKSYSSQIDLTTATYDVYKPETDNRVYRYEKGDIVNTLLYSEDNAVNDDFVANPIIYDPALTTPNTKDIVVSVTTDMDNVIADPDSASNSGVYLARCIPLSTNYLIAIDENTLTPGTFKMSAKLGWAYLFENYFKYYGEAGTADINNGATLTLSGVKEFLKQDDIKFFYSGELDWKKPVTLNNGTGWIEKIEESDSEFLTLNVGFDPYL